MNRDLGEDLTQNTFLRMIKYKHTFQSDSNFKSWVFRIARNVHADHYRKTEKMKSSELDNYSFEAEELTVDDAIAKTDQEKLLYIALYRLKPEEKEVILLSKFEKLKYAEIAAIYETSISAIKTKVHRAMAELRQVFFELEKI